MTPYQALGEALVGGHGAHRDAAFRRGLNEGWQERRLMAQTALFDVQTQRALAQARALAQRNDAREAIGSALADAGVGSQYAPLVNSGAANWPQLVQGLAAQEERTAQRDARAGLGDALRAVGVPADTAPLVTLGAADVEGLRQALAEPDATPAPEDLGPALQALGLSPEVAPLLQAGQGSDTASLLNALTKRSAEEKGPAPAARTRPTAEQLVPGGQGRSVIPPDIEVENAFGLGNTILHGLESTLGWTGIPGLFGVAPIAPERVKAINYVRELAARTKIAIRTEVPNAGRVSNQVQDILNTYAEDPVKFFRSRSQALANLHTTRNELLRLQGRIRRLLDSGVEMTPTMQVRTAMKYTQLSDTLADYDQLLNRLVGKGTAGTTDVTPPPSALPPDMHWLRRPQTDGWEDLGDGLQYRVKP